ncbi:MFS transporter [Leekyejoonella antrihumi]|uniref:MFS transporter n=1 Tax=Leekyejoonella antrihumi TaxID=1660198 RepID=A0A563E3W4_9MICO|nr:MFS transporter [Leekyejoonella antrihumi]TWP36922.1 MFS transporter [Leekyejoonella antrihumi]
MAAGPRVKDSLASVRKVLRNRNLRRVQLAFFGSGIGDWSYATALAVYAYQHGGVTAVGIFQAVRFLVRTMAGPLGAVIADRVPRRAFMMGSDATRAVLVAVAAVGVGLGTPSFVVYALTLLAVVAGSSFRAAQAGLIPQLVDHPEELIATNAVSGILENTYVVTGAALGGVFVGVFGVEATFWLNVATFAWSFLLVLGVRVAKDRRAEPVVSPPEADRPPEQAQLEQKSGFVAEAGAGFRVVAKDGDLRSTALLAASQTFVWGILSVITLLIAIQMLGTGPSGIGYMDTCMGIGSVIGGALVLTRLARGTLGRDMVSGVLGYCLPLLLLAALPGRLTAIMVLMIVGLAEPFVNVGFDTIPQRIVPDEVLSRGYGAMESMSMASMTAGAFMAPVLVHLLGLRATLAVPSIIVIILAFSRFARMRGLDARLREPPELALLRTIPLFEPLDPPMLESLARQVVTVEVPAGNVVISAGEASDRFYLIDSGVVEVTQDDRVLRREGPGEFFGEIGLLRDVPRTATITAVGDTKLLALERADFLGVLAGTAEGRSRAEDVVARRLAV